MLSSIRTLLSLPNGVLLQDLLNSVKQVFLLNLFAVSEYASQEAG